MIGAVLPKHSLTHHILLIVPVSRVAHARPKVRKSVQPSGTTGETSFSVQQQRIAARHLRICLGFARRCGAASLIRQMAG